MVAPHLSTEFMLAVIIGIFVAGYLAIALEHNLNINKAASALLVGVACWTLYAIDSEELVSSAQIAAHATESDSTTELLSGSMQVVEQQLLHITAEIAGILFFLMGAMTIVEVIDGHEGFQIVTKRIRPKSKVQLMWLVCMLSFLLSALLDNLTTSIVMVSVLRKLVRDKELRMFYCGMVVVSANAGGAWTVIGDVTTTMLWIKHRIDAVQVMWDVFLPSLACLLAPLAVLSLWLKGPLEPIEDRTRLNDKKILPWHQWTVLIVGVCGLLSVPILKTLTHLPPFMGMMLALSVLWIVSELVGRTMDNVTRSSTGILSALTRVDMSSVLFFLGILLAVGSLSATGVLTTLAVRLNDAIPDHSIVAILIGLVSAVVDNVPLVAAGIDMYEYPANDLFWMLLAYCAGTGGSCLIIGSASGVAVMGLEHIPFFWYFKKIAPLALLGYLTGVIVFALQHQLWM